MTLTPDQLLWLSNNKPGYERILMHSILHDRAKRTAMLGVPLRPDDFGAVSLGAILQGLILATSVMQRMDLDMPYPPTVEQLKSYMFAATKEADSKVSEDDLEGAYTDLNDLQDPRRKEHWYYLDTYFVAWLTSVRAKVYGRKAQVNPITDAPAMALLIEQDMRRASSAIYSFESDDMHQALYGTSEEGKIRRPTGFDGLDEATNGGWGEAECYGLVAPTGGGKSIAAGQTGYYTASTGGDTLILTTELPVIEYMVRMISNACNIKIGLIQDCLNMGQVRAIVALDNPVALDKVDMAIRVMTERMRIVKLHPDQGLNARAIMDREIAIYEQLKGRKPTLVIFDWLGRVADVAASGSSSDRTVAWEKAADSCVQFSEVSGIPSLILLQATNDSTRFQILSREHIGISKGVIKQMHMAFAISAWMDPAAIKQALLNGGQLQSTMRTTPDEQVISILKARKGEGTYIPVKRNFAYQRFVSAKQR